MPSALSGAQLYVDGEDSSRLINSSFSKVPKAGPSTHRSPLLHYFWCVYSTNTYDTSLAVDGSDLSTAGVYRGTWLFNLPAILFFSPPPCLSLNNALSFISLFTRNQIQELLLSNTTSPLLWLMRAHKEKNERETTVQARPVHFHCTEVLTPWFPPAFSAQTESRYCNLGNSPSLSRPLHFLLSHFADSFDKLCCLCFSLFLSGPSTTVLSFW